MSKLFARYVAALVTSLIAVSFLVFALNELSPGSAALKVLGPYALPEQITALTKELGLDRPFVVRYVEYVVKALRGDFGRSILFNAPVSDVIGAALLNTAILAATAFVVIVPLSILLGVLGGMREGSILDRGVVLFTTISSSIPDYAMGVMLITVFVVKLGVLPGLSPMVAQGQWSIAQQMVLPVAVITLFDCGYVAAMVRASMVDVMERPFIRTAILKGLPNRLVVARHALRNALIAPVTVILLQINYLITGVVVVESMFAYPGFGRMMLEAALAKDIALIEAGSLIAVFIAVSTNFLGDLCYALLDPRIRAQGKP